MATESKTSSNTSSKPKSNMRISGIGIFIFVVLMIVAVIGSALMDQNNVSPTISVTFVIVDILVGIYLLLAIKIAAQWEKAVLL